MRKYNYFDFKDRVTAVKNSPSDLFTDLVKASRMNPTIDLRYGNWTNLVFKETENLTGFNFTGADLTGSNPDVAIVDRTTIFINAKLDAHVKEALRAKGAVMELTAPTPMPSRKHRKTARKLARRTNG